MRLNIRPTSGCNIESLDLNKAEVGFSRILVEKFKLLAQRFSYILTYKGKGRERTLADV
jgi:hypothetical protein